MTDDIGPAPRGVFTTIGRISILRILFMGLALMAGEGLIFAFHFEYGKGHMPCPIPWRSTTASASCSVSA